ncbi:hypothetical protein GCM10023088_34960 [Actinomadura verrucosospora]|uniref:hypothetical protein n=1 Tax=Actinomadura TaxID=1988 RepID=UPI0031E5340D
MSDEDKNAKAYQQLGRLKSTLREREARLDEMEKRLAALEASTAVQFGRLVAGAARNPRRGKRLPRELYRLWRKRSAPVSAAARATGGGVQPDRVERPEDRLLVAGPCDVPIIAGVLAPGTAAVLAGHARVVALYPHDAAIALETADVDALVVDAAAGEPGGPWAYLGVPGMYDRDLALHEIRRIAAARSLPLVLWGEAPPATLASLHWDATATAPAGLVRLLDPAPSPDAGGGPAATSGATTSPAR